MHAAAAEAMPPDVAWDLYESAKVLPGTSTRATILSEQHISLNGPLQERHPFLISGVDGNSRKAIVVKLLPAHEVHFKQVSATTACVQ